MEILFFTKGDSSDITLWSNVPFLMFHALEKKDIIIHRINFAPDRFIHKFFNILFIHLLKRKDYSFERSLIYKKIADFKIKKAIIKFPKADVCFFMSFNFYNYFSNIPSLVFSDFTYEMKLPRNKKRDKRFALQEKNVFENANIVIPFFKDTFDFINSNYKPKNILYAGFTPINLFFKDKISEKSVIKDKYKSNEIVFIGGKHYREGLKYLFDATKNTDCKINVVGMKKEDVDFNSNKLFFYGYLNKNNPLENETYYDLLKRAKILVNTTPNWNGYSSILEALFLYTPIIISPIKEFNNEFGNDIDFGIICKKPENLFSNIKSIFSKSENDYRQMCLKAHGIVKDNTWERYANFLINSIFKVL